jgi:hypothetical protein
MRGRETERNQETTEGFLFYRYIAKYFLEFWLVG